MTTDGQELLRRGNRAVAARQYAAAEEAFQALIDAEPQNPEGYLGLAKVLFRQSRRGAVVELLEPVHGRFPMPRVLRQLADALRAMAYEPGAPPAVADRAIWFYRAAAAARPDPVSLFYLGELLRELKQEFMPALRAYQESWQLDPGSPTVRQAALACARRLGTPEASAIVSDMELRAGQ